MSVREKALFAGYGSTVETIQWGNYHSHLRGYTFWQRRDEQGQWEDIPKDLLKQQELLMKLVVPIQTAGPFWLSAIEPNLPWPNSLFGTTHCYQWAILGLVAPGRQFHPLMSIQIHSGTTPDTIREVCYRYGRPFTKQAPDVFGKLYLEKVTNSPIGVRAEDVFSDQMRAVFAEMQLQGMVLQVHPEAFCVNDIFGCEKAFIPILIQLHKLFPRLKISVEHISTKELLEVVLSLPANVVGSITIHHLIGDTADFWRDGVVYDPFNFCRSVLRFSEDRMALIAAIADPVNKYKLILGLDDAPHLKSVKLDKGSPGIWLPAWAAASLLLEIGEENQIPLEAIVDFACLNGARFYEQNVPKRTITFRRIEVVIPDIYPIDGSSPVYGDVSDDIDGVVPYLPRHPCRWQLVPDA